MRRIAVLVTAGLVGMLLWAGPARADFHGLCTPTPDNPTNANIALTESATTLDFAGHVNCGGATSLAITSLVLTPFAPSGSPTSAPTASCSDPNGVTCNHVETSASAPVATGIYNVSMSFLVVGKGVTNPERHRFARYLVTGQGQPTLLCGGKDANTSTCP